MQLAGKKFLIVGGTGFVGNFIARRLTHYNPIVTCLSRSGPKKDYPQNSKINWICGSIMDAKYHQKIINDADVIIHTVGTLFDTSITKFRKPGQAGTYEQMNRDSFLRLLQQVKTRKKIIYISASGAPPFIPRYITTKHQAQQALFNSIHQGYSVRPGFIYSWNERWWSLPLKYQIDLYNAAYPHVLNFVGKGSPKLRQFINQLQVKDPTPLYELVHSIFYLSQFGYQKNILQNSDFRNLNEKFLDTVNGYVK